MVRTVVVTGAAGSLGRRVTTLLAGRADVGRVIAIDRTALRLGPGDPGPSVEGHQLDMLEAPTGAVEELIGGADGVIHLAWQAADAPVDGAGPHAASSEANRQVLLRVLAGAGRGASTLVHLSSATVYGAWPDNRIPLTEDSPLRPNPEFGYAVAKAEAERRLAEWADDHPNVAVSVLRPAVTLGSPERPLYQALAGTRSPGTTDEARPVQYLHADDLATAVVLAWEQRLAGVYNVAPDNGIGEDTARALAGGLARLRLPGPLARAVTAWSWDLGRRGVPRQARAYAEFPWVVAADKLRAAGWSPTYSSEEALVATDARPHWDDLPPGRRQNVTLLVIVASAIAGVGAIAGLVLAVRARRRR